MVSAPNSLSMNAVNFQKAKSAPLVIKKNISTTPVQINKKTIDEGTMRKMLDEADQSGVDKGEIIQGLLDRGYDIEEPKTFMQKAGQIGKNIVGGTLGGLPALGPNLLGGAMKGLGSLGVAPGLPAQTKITQGMKDVGQELISRGEQARNITEKALGANPNDTSTQLARSVVPIASQIIASGPLGLTKAGAGAFQTAKAGIAARSLPTIAKGVAQGAAVGGAEQAMFDVAQTGETTPGNIALGATVGGALPVAVPLVQSAGKYVKNVLPGKLVSSAEESVSKALAPTKNKMKQLTERISPEFLKKGIRGSKESMQKLAKENAEKFGIKIDDAIESGVLDDVVIPRGEVDKILHEAKLTTMVGNKVVNDTKYKVVAGLQDMISQFPEAIQGREARALRQILDEVVYATKGGIGAEDLTYKNGLVKAMANTLRSEISKVAPDLASLNKEFSFYRTLEQILDETITRQKPQSGMLRKGASILFAGQQEGIGNKIMGYVGSKVFLDATSSATWNTISAQLKYKLANAIARGNPIAVNEVVKIINKKHNAGLPEMKALPAPKATVVAPGGLPQVKQPIAPLTKPIQILETGKANIKQPSTTKPQTLPPSTKAPLVQSTKTAPKLPVAKKTPLKQASESGGNVDIETSIQKAKAEGKTFDEFVSSQEKEGKILYHGTDEKFDKFDIGKSGEKGNTMGNGINLAEKKAEAEFYSKNKNTVKTFLDKDIKIKSFENSADFIQQRKKSGFNSTDASNEGIKNDIKNYSKYLQDQGYDGIMIPENPNYRMRSGGADYGKNYTIFNPSKIKTEAQLKKIREQAQTGKTAPTRLPALGTDTQKLSPKKKTPLIKATPLSKVDDALPVGEKMGDLPQKAKSLDTSDLTTSIKKAKAEGKTFDDYISSQEKEGKILYHGTDTDIEEFSTDFIGKGGDAQRVEGAGLGKGIYLTNKQQEAKYYADLVANQNRDKNFRDKHSDYTKKIEEMFDKGEITKEKATEMYMKGGPMRSEFERSKNIVKSVVNGKIATKKDIESIFGSKLPKKYIDDGFGKRVQIIDQEKINSSLKNKGFVGREEIYTMAGQKLGGRDEARNIVIFDPKQIKTEAQLRSMRDKTTPTPTTSLGKPLPKVDDSLLVEARKYKSADDMIKTFRKDKKIVFHGGKDKIETFNLDNLASNEDNIVSKQGLFFAKDRSIAKTYAGDDGKVTSAFLNVGDDKIYKVDYKGGRPLMDSVAGTIENAKKAGYKAVEIKGWRDGVGGTQYVVFDPKDIVTESQIRNIYNK